MKAPSNPMSQPQGPQPQGPVVQMPDPNKVRKFGQRLQALQALKGRVPVWMLPHEAAHASQHYDIMPHPDLDINDLTK